MNSYNKQTQSSNSDSFKIELPKGGGAVRGADANFHADAFTGGAKFSLPIDLPQARMSPSLSLGYSSSSGNGLLGAGCHLSTMAVSRKTSRAIPKYDDENHSNVFLLNGQELVHDQGNLYKEQHQSGFPHIEKIAPNNDTVSHWKLITGQNETFIYGDDSKSTVNEEKNIAVWNLTHQEDSHGNKVLYNYQRSKDLVDGSVNDNNTYLESIEYGNFYKNENEEFAFKVFVDYGQIDITQTIATGSLHKNNKAPLRQDVLKDFRNGFEVATELLIHNILVFHYSPDEEEHRLVAKTSFVYEENAIMSFLKSVQETKYQYTKNGNKLTVNSRSIPPVSLTFTQFKTKGEQKYQKIDNTIIGNTPLEFADIEGEGLAGILSKDKDAIRYFSPKGAATYEAVATAINVPSGYTDPNQQIHLASLEGNGLKQLISNQHPKGFYEMESLEKWSEFQTFENQDIDDLAYATEYADLTGNSKTDHIVITEDQIFFTPSLGKKGMGKRVVLENTHNVPGNPVLHTDPFVYFGFANMYGDGISHRVKIEHQKITIWPCLGYGKFGAKREITIPDFDIQTNQLDLRKRLYLTDFSGNGKTDLLLIEADHIKVFLNENGTSFQAPFKVALPQGELFTDLDSLQFADITGDGQSDLIISKQGYQTTHYYLPHSTFIKTKVKGQLQKAYLVESMTNNLGASSDMVYKSSIQYYLEAKKTDTPWYTKMYNPVIVVDKTIAHDYISGTRLESQNNYRDGYYDPEFYTFIGFGCVEHKDTSHQGKEVLPTVVSRQWFHLGNGLNEDIVKEQFFQQKHTDVPFEVIEGKVKSISQAKYALVGSVIHSEVYDEADLKRQAKEKLDDQIQEDDKFKACPYHAHSASYTVKEIEAPKGDQKGVYQIYANENVEINYEKKANDPLIAQECVLEVDKYLHPTLTCSVHYARKAPFAFIPEQKVTHVTAATASFKYQEDLEARWLGIALESKGFEILGLNLDANYQSYDVIKKKVIGALANPVPYQQQDIKEPSARLLSWEKPKYWKDVSNQNELLDLEKDVIPNILLPAYSQHIELNEKLLEDLYISPYENSTKGKNLLGNSKEEIDVYMTQSGYVFEQGYWWHRSEKSHYLEDKTSFYMPYKSMYDFEGIADYLKTESEVVYDELYLFPKISKVKYADGKYITTSSEIDYRILHPTSVTDPNGNKAEAIYDVLGAVIATAHYSKDAQEGNLPLAQYHVKKVESIQDVLENPLDYIQQAGSFFHYEFAKKVNDRWIPSNHVALTSTVYKTENPDDIQRAIVYNDAFGRTIESKAYAGEGKMTFTDEVKEKRWLASGRVEYNSKGQPWKSYLGYFSETWEHEYDWEKNVKAHLPNPSVITYDALGRNIHGETPKGFFTKVEFTSAWENRHYDVNDTVKDSEYYKKGTWKMHPNEVDAIEKAEKHYNTPAIATIDALGHAIQSYELKEAIDPTTPLENIDPTNENVLVTWQEYDIQGRVLKQADARFFEGNFKETQEKNRQYNFLHFYPIVGHEIKTIGTDNGTHIHFEDATGNALKEWDALGYEHAVEYDNLHRPTKKFVNTFGAGPNLDQCVGQVIYGECLKDPAEQNAYGQVLKTYDSAGLTTVEGYTFDGHPLSSAFNMLKEFKTEANWDSLEVNENTFVKETYTSTATFDAAGRPLSKTNPDESVETFTYGVMGNVVKSTICLKGGEIKTITHGSELDANGHLQHVYLGNGLKTQNTYDKLSLQLTRIQTLGTNKDTNETNGRTVQDLSYTHDPSGLITQTKNNNETTKVFDGSVIDNVFSYTYDALYQLTEATGRCENKGLWFTDGKDVQHQKQDKRAIGNYQHKYTYDKARNLLCLKQSITNANTRTFSIDTHSNRILSYSCSTRENNQKPQKMEYDIAGQQLNLHKNGPKLAWNTYGNIANTTIVEREGKQNDVEYYVYDGNGMRVRKVTLTLEHGKVTKTIDKRYLGDYTQSLTYTQNNEEVSIDHRKITVSGVQKHDAVVEYYAVKKNLNNHPTNEKPLLRFQHADVINSVGIETNGEGQIISYEEYTPFGETALSWTNSQLDISPKEHRYSAQEKDKTTGLYYYGYRYYNPITCSWTKPDPAGTIDGMNLYAMVGNEPVGKFDVLGLFPKTLISAADRRAKHKVDPAKRNNLGSVSNTTKKKRGVKKKKQSKKRNNKQKKQTSINKPIKKNSNGSDVKSIKRRQYRSNVYGSRVREQNRLIKDYDFSWDGNKLNQHEHSIGLKSATFHHDYDRKEDPEYIERDLPTYAETYEAHQANIGTGNRKEDPHNLNLHDALPDTMKNDPKVTDLASNVYRGVQAHFLAEGKPHIAILFNQLTYAHTVGVDFISDESNVLSSHDSFIHHAFAMIGQKIPYIDINGTKQACSIGVGDFYDLVGTRLILANDNNFLVDLNQKVTQIYFDLMENNKTKIDVKNYLVDN